jgi:hypothetical protein
MDFSGRSISCGQRAVVSNTPSFGHRSFDDCAPSEGNFPQEITRKGYLFPYPKGGIWGTRKIAS